MCCMKKCFISATTRPQVKNTVTCLQVLQVYGYNPRAITKKDVGGSYVTVHENLIVFPHKSFCTPLFL